MTGKIFIDQLANGTSFIDEQQGDAMSEIRRYTVCCHVASEQPHDGPHQYRVEGDDGPYVLWEDHQAEVERLKAENARLTVRALAAIEALKEPKDTP